MKFEKLRKEFADPPRAFRPAPLWVWNTRVTRADIDRMLGDFKAQGFGGAFVHPRPGLVTEYLSDEWFDLYKYSVERGKNWGSTSGSTTKTPTRAASQADMFLHRCPNPTTRARGSRSPKPHCPRPMRENTSSA